MANEEHLEILSQGLKAWNEWRDKNQHITPDLSGIFTVDIELKFGNIDAFLGDENYQKGIGIINFSHTNFKKSVFIGADFSHANLCFASLSGAVFGIGGVLFANANLDGADLSGADFDSESNFSNANLINANLSGATFNEGPNFSNASLIKANLSGATFISDLHLAEEIVHEGLFLDENQVVLNKNLDPSHIDPTCTNFSGADLTEADLSGVTFKNKYDFSRTRVIFPGPNFSNSNLARANLSNASLTNKANFSRANLENASFTGADLANASFREANLTGANFTGANLTGADMENADITAADFTDATLTGVNMGNAIDRNTDKTEKE